MSYLHSPSFSANNTFSEYTPASPPESPIASSDSSFSQRASSRASRTSGPAPAASASGPDNRSPEKLITLASAPVALDQSTEALGILIPNERMEAGLSLRRSPLVPAKEFAPESRSPIAGTAAHWNQTVFVDDAAAAAAATTAVDSNDPLYQTGFTGDIDLHGQYVYRRPYINRASSQSRQRSQLILEQKYNRHRSASSSTHDSEFSARAFISPQRAQSYRRPGTAPQSISALLNTPDSAPARLEYINKASSPSPGGLRGLSTEAAAQPASKRASWLRRTRDFETHSDSLHLPNSPVPDSVTPASASTAASRRHSSTHSGDYRSATLMPILASNSFDVPDQQNVKRRSLITGKARNPVTATSESLPGESSEPAGAPSSQRNSMLSNGSSAPSSRGEANVDFDGDEQNQQAHSSASSGFEHEQVLATKPTTAQSTGGLEVDSKNTEVFITPRSSSEQEKLGQPSDKDSAAVPSISHQTTDASADAIDTDAAALQDVISAEREAVVAPAIPGAMVSPLQTAVVPPSPTAPERASPEQEVLSAPSDASQPSGGLSARSESPTKSLSSDQNRGSSPGTPVGALAVPNGRPNGLHTRRDSSNSVASAASSSSTYRIRRKAVPSDLDESERRQSVTSLPNSEAAEAASRRSSLAASLAPSLPPKDDAVHAIQAALISSGSVESRMAPVASQGRVLANGTNRPSTAVPSPAKPGTFGLGAVQQQEASASTRDLSTSSATAAGVGKSAATRSASRATIKRPTTAPVGNAGQLRAVSEAQKAVLEVEGQQFVLGKDQATKETPAQDLSPSIPNAVRFMQPIKGEAGTKSAQDSSSPHGNATSVSRQGSRRLNNASTGTTGASANGAGVTRSPSAAGGWGLEEELQIVDKVQNANVTSPSKAQKPPRASLDKNRKSLDAASKAHFKNNVLMNIINEDESDEVKAAAREAGIPEGSYAIHPPSMLQLFEASQCLVYNEDGQEVLFGDIYKKRRTLVCFLRHWWCGFCQQFAMSVRNIDPLPLKKANLDFVIVGQGDWHVIKAYREVMQVQYPMFADPKRNVYRALGMTLRTNDANPACARPDYASMSMTKGILVAIKKGLFDMPIRNPGDMKLLGGDFILGPGLQCSFTHRMTTADGHMDIPRILAQAGCDMSLKMPKPLFMLDEKAARSATLAGGNQNRRQTRSIGRARSKKKNVDDVNTMDSTFGNTTGSAVAAGSVGHGSHNPRSRPSLWGRFPGRFSRSQVSLPASMSQADVSTDQSHDRGFAAGPRPASAMRVRESFDTQNTGVEFESRATSFDTRRRPSDVSGQGAFGFGTLKQASSMSELRKRFEMGGLGSFRSKLRQDPSKVSLDGRLAVPGSGNSRLQHNASTHSLRGGAQANGVNGANEAATPTQETFAAAKQVNGAGVNAAQLAPSGLTVPVAEANGPRARSSLEAAQPPQSPGLAPPGSFLEDLDVYDSMSSLSAIGKPNGDSSEPASSVADHGSHDPPLQSIDMEPSLSGTRTPTGSQRAAPAGEGGHAQSSSFQSHNVYRAQPLEHLVEETDEDGDDSRDRIGHDTEDSETDEDDEENDEPIEFESGLSGRF